MVVSSTGRADMTEKNEETFSLNLRSMRRQTIAALYALKEYRNLPICRLVDEIVTEYVDNEPDMNAIDQEAARRLADEFGGIVETIWHGPVMNFRELP
jgi:hypothetical protein